MEHQVKHHISLVVAILVLIIAILVLVIAHDYRGGSGIFPKFIGWIFVGLTVTECLVQLKALLSSGTNNHFLFNFLKPSERVMKEIRGVIWIGFFLTVLYLGGFLVGIPLYIFAFLRLSAGRSYKQAVLFSVGATGCIYFLFIELLQYRLYQGLIFG